MSSRVLNLVAFPIGWLACMLGAGQGRPMIGPLVVAILLGLNVFQNQNPTAHARFNVTVGLIGLIVDSGLAAMGLFTYPESGLPPWLSPPWLIAAWMMFGSTIPVSLRWLSGRTTLAASFGAVFGPVSYYVGSKLGALAIPVDPAAGLLILAALWGLLLPGLLLLADRMVPAPSSSGAMA